MPKAATDGGEFQIDVGGVEFDDLVLHREFEQFGLVAVGLLVAELDGEHFFDCGRRRSFRPSFGTSARRPCGLSIFFGRVGGDDFVERGHRVAGPDLAGVLGVVVEILLVEHAVFVAEQAVAFDVLRVELDLDLHVLGDGDQRAGEPFDQQLLGLVDGVDVAVVAVALVGQLFQRRVLVVAHAETQHGQEDALLGLLFDHVDQFRLVGGADIEIAVGAKDDAVDALLDVVGRRRGVGQLDPGPAVGRSAGLQAVERFENLLFVAARGRRQHQPRGTGVDDDGHAVLGVEILDQHLHGVFQQRQLVRLLHRAGDVQQKHQVGRAAALPSRSPAL